MYNSIAKVNRNEESYEGWISNGVIFFNLSFFFFLYTLKCFFSCLQQKAISSLQLGEPQLTIKYPASIYSFLMHCDRIEREREIGLNDQLKKYARLRTFHTDWSMDTSFPSNERHIDAENIISIANWRRSVLKDRLVCYSCQGGDCQDEYWTNVFSLLVGYYRKVGPSNVIGGKAKEKTMEAHRKCCHQHFSSIQN